MKRDENFSSQSGMSKAEGLFLQATLLSLCDMQSVEAWIAYSSPQTRLTLLMHIEPLIKMVQEELQFASTPQRYNQLLNGLNYLIRVRAPLVAAPDSSLVRDMSFASHPTLY